MSTGGAAQIVICHLYFDLENEANSMNCKHQVLENKTASSHAEACVNPA